LEEDFTQRTRRKRRTWKRKKGFLPRTTRTRANQEW